MKTLNEKVVVITGASSGLGSILADLVVQYGGMPVLIARSEEKLAKVAASIQEKHGVNVSYYVADVSNLNQIIHVFKAIASSYTNIDVLINNAGYGVFRSFIDAPVEDFEDMMKVNYLGTVYCTKQVLPNMLKQKQGHIINVASQAGKVGSAKSTAYSASKHAVLGFTNSLRFELKQHHIHVSAVNPGPVRTPFFAIADRSGQYVKNISKYMLDPHDVAEQIIHLIMRPTRELNLPWWMNLGSHLFTLFPTLMEKIMSRKLNQK
jgi:short-subunit dehydrogenase